jgi:thiamine pyrophosphate-dependent acetolactate synthase large subunit-like protein
MATTLTHRPETRSGRVTLTGSEALVRALRAAGIRDVFGVAGGSLVRVLKAVADDPDLRYVGVRHEAAGGFMAAATFAATGRLALALGEQGPGSLNLLSGMGNAFNNNLALVAVTSSPPTTLSRPFHGMFMEWDAQSAYRAYTKHSAQANAAARVPQLVRDTVRAALTGRPGPVHLDLPTDVLFEEDEFDVAELEAPLESYVPALRPGGDPAAIERAADLLAGAERPLVIAGGGVARSDASHELRDVVRLLGALGTATQMGIGAVDSTAPDFIGHGGVIGGPAVLRALREADAVLAVGVRFSSWMWDGHAPAVRGGPGQRVVHVDVDAAVPGRLVPVDVPIAGDAKTVLGQLLEALPAGGERDDAWKQSLVDEYRRHRAAIDELAAQEREPMHPATLAKELGEWLPDDALVVYDGGHTTFWSNELTPATETRTRFHDPGMAHLGFGTPYALALKHAFPERTVVNTIGDGSFGFTIQELDTARRYGLDAIHVLHDNAAFGIIRAGQEANGFELGGDLVGTDYVAIGRSFGCHAERVTRREEIKPALDRAAASGLPAVVDVEVCFEPYPSLDAFRRMAMPPAASRARPRPRAPQGPGTP